jgi:Na+/alanine symporter
MSSVDAAINAVFEPVARAVSAAVFAAVPVGAGHEVQVILIWLIAAGVFFTAYLGFVNIRAFPRAWALLFDRSAGGQGQISPLQALATSLSGTVGLGNIAGVAVAISVGGPGAALWMAVAGVLGMSTKLAEVALGIAHAAVKTDCPVSQGLVGMLGPFIDTVVICMITALVIVVTGVADGGQGMEGVALTSRAFEAAAWWAPYGLFVVVILFAYSTMIAWSYYGLKAFTYLFGQGPRREAGFKVAYCACIVVGASAQLGHVIAFTDAAVFAMAIPNIIGLYALAPALRRDLRAYLASARA